uniref:Uncharacterized protein n=2 Tax=Pseudomonadota TaxID=1224 RepID=C6BBR1_RALP1
MALQNDFLPFATGGSANVLTQAQYAALISSVIANGFSSGVAQSAQLNKVWRQSSIMAAVLAQLINSNAGQPAVDDGTTATLLANLTTAISVIARQNPVLTDTGTANAYVVSNAAPLTAYPTVSGLTIDVSIANTNTGASTLNVDGLGTKPILGLGLQPLQGNELPQKGVACLMYVVASNVNGGNGAWIVMECTGGAQQVGPATQSQHAVQLGQLGQVGHGQCRLSYVSGTQLKLSPYNGNNLIINGVPQQIPSAGVTLANTGLAASTKYYVYAYMNAGTMTLEAVTTAHATGTNGVEQKSGDATRTLVGMILTDGSTPGQFVDTPANRQIANWFNRRIIPGVATLTIDTNFTGGSFAKVTTSLDVTFPYWGDNDGGIASLSGSVANNTSGGQSLLAVFVDGSPFGNTASASVSGSTIQNASVTSLSLLNNAALTEGFHVASAYGASSTSSTSTLRASTVVTVNSRA